MLQAKPGDAEKRGEAMNSISVLKTDNTKHVSLSHGYARTSLARRSRREAERGKPQLPLIERRDRRPGGDGKQDQSPKQRRLLEAAAAVGRPDRIEGDIDRDQDGGDR